MTVVWYEHHGRRVAVVKERQGKHREYCLCFMGCSLFKPGQPDNCPIAQATYENCVRFGITTPVFGCPEYDPIQVSVT